MVNNQYHIYLVPYPRLKSEVKQKVNQEMELMESGSLLEEVKDLLKFTFKCFK